MRHKITGLFFGSILLFVIITSGCVDYKDGTLSNNFQNENITTPLSTPLQKQYNNMTHEQFTQALEPPKDVTQLQMDDFYNSVNRLSSQYVTWRLQVEDVTSNSVQLRVGSSNMDNMKKVVLYVAEDQKSKLHSLNKGEYITIEGKPNNLRNALMNAIRYQESGSPSYYLLMRVELTDGKIISKG